MDSCLRRNDDVVVARRLLLEEVERRAGDRKGPTGGWTKVFFGLLDSKE